MRRPGRRRVAGLALILAAFGGAIYGYGLIQQGQAINEQRGNLSRLIHELCTDVAAQRDVQNAEVRGPLRAVLDSEASLRRALSRQRGLQPRLRRALRRQARALEEAKGGVPLIAPIHCRFETVTGPTSSPGAMPSGPVLVTPSPSPAAVVEPPSPLPAPSSEGPSPPGSSPPPTPSPSPSPSPSPCPVPGGAHCHSGVCCGHPKKH
jgi:hypothetical protein